MEIEFKAPIENWDEVEDFSKRNVLGIAIGKPSLLQKVDEYYGFKQIEAPKQTKRLRQEKSFQPSNLTKNLIVDFFSKPELEFDTDTSEIHNYITLKLKNTENGFETNEELEETYSTKQILLVKKLLEACGQEKYFSKRKRSIFFPISAFMSEEIHLELVQCKAESNNETVNSGVYVELEYVTENLLSTEEIAEKIKLLEDVFKTLFHREPKKDPRPWMEILKFKS